VKGNKSLGYDENECMMGETKHEMGIASTGVHLAYTY